MVGVVNTIKSNTY